MVADHQGGKYQGGMRPRRARSAAPPAARAACRMPRRGRPTPGRCTGPHRKKEQHDVRSPLYAHTRRPSCYQSARHPPRASTKPVVFELANNLRPLPSDHDPLRHQSHVHPTVQHSASQSKARVSCFCADASSTTTPGFSTNLAAGDPMYISRFNHPNRPPRWTQCRTPSNVQKFDCAPYETEVIGQPYDTEQVE
jgi:hypothetical protein